MTKPSYYEGDFAAGQRQSGAWATGSWKIGFTERPDIYPVGHWAPNHITNTKRGIFATVNQ